MKRGIAAIMSVILMTTLASCGITSGHDAYKEIYKRYNAMESFRAAAEITVKNERTENTYFVRQAYAAPDRFSMTVEEPAELAGSGYVFGNGEVVLKSGFGHNETLTGFSPSSRSAVFLVDFFEEYYRSEDAYVETLGKSNPDETVMSCMPSDGDKNRFSQSLWIDNKTFLPIRLETYDSNGNMTVRVKFVEFERNCDIEDSDFE